MRYFTPHDDDAQSSSAVIDLSPLLDMVFLLLIFFITTTTFTKDNGMAIQRPAAQQAHTLPADALQLVITRDNRIFYQQTQLHVHSLQDEIRLLLGGQERPVTLVADREAASGTLITVIDQCKLAGARAVAVATIAP